MNELSTDGVVAKYNLNSKKLIHSLAPSALWPTATLKQQHSNYILFLFMVTQAYFQFLKGCMYRLLEIVQIFRL